MRYIVSLSTDETSLRQMSFAKATQGLTQFVHAHGGEVKGPLYKGDIVPDSGLMVIELPEEALPTLEEQNFVARLPIPGDYKDIFPLTPADEEPLPSYDIYDYR